MNTSFPPLYPQEAYPEQQNLQGQSNMSTCSCCQSSQNMQNNFSTTNFSGNMGSLILPLLLKSMGGNLPMQDMLKSLGVSSNPLLNALSSLSDKKNSPTECVGEKQFPES